MNAILPEAQAYHPRCFSDASQYQQWHSYAIKCSAGESDYCTDCTGAYQHQMIKECRSNHPKTRFFVDCDGFAQGRRPGGERLVHCRQKGRR